MSEKKSGKAFKGRQGHQQNCPAFVVTGHHISPLSMDYVIASTSGKQWWLSRTHKLITQIAQVCKELRAMVKEDHSIKTSHNPLSTGRMNKGRPPDRCGKDGTGCTRSKGNKKHAHYEDLSNSPNTQKRHETSSPPLPLPPSSPSPTSSLSEPLYSSAPNVLLSVFLR